MLKGVEIPFLPSNRGALIIFGGENPSINWNPIQKIVALVLEFDNRMIPLKSAFYNSGRNLPIKSFVVI